MATYQLQIDFSNLPFPQNLCIINFTNNTAGINPDLSDINSLQSTICNEFIYYLYNVSSCISSLKNNTLFITITAEGDPESDYGNLLGLTFINYDKGEQLSANFIPTTITACPTCQEVVINNCAETLYLKAPGINGFYNIQIEDHQTGIIYTQTLEFDGGGEAYWVTTATPGLFNPFSVYTVTILDAEGEPVSWIDGTNEYNCMRLTFKQFTDTTPA